MAVMLNAVDYPDPSNEIDFMPCPDVVLSGAQKLSLMEADRIRSGKFCG